jgi:hypothetical protein
MTALAACLAVSMLVTWQNLWKVAVNQSDRLHSHKTCMAMSAEGQVGVCFATTWHRTKISCNVEKHKVSNNARWSNTHVVCRLFPQRRESVTSLTTRNITQGSSERWASDCDKFSHTLPLISVLYAVTDCYLVTLFLPSATRSLPHPLAFSLSNLMSLFSCRVHRTNRSWHVTK